LDPPLTLVLDEAALICPIPLDKWTADMGGRNITIHIAVQSRAQLRHRWGDTGAAAILNNAATLLVFGGGRDTDDLTVYSTLTGHRTEHLPTQPTRRLGRNDQPVGGGVQRVPVLTPAQIAQLEPGRVVIFRRGMPPALGTVDMAWNRRDVRAAARTHRRTTRRAERQANRAVRRAAWVLRRASIRKLINDIHELPVSWTGRVPKGRVHAYLTDEPTHPDT
jgi:type IV secretory pathway TraG/TraD family ATPase VirD4